ncbi:MULTISPECIES: hypothetical protein [unclassified Streptomyces]|uniref:hypothetical protein n=1 Tax=unclassified Streptomyces TaxID=2593676 RepID=UPI002DDC4D97|nr:hypothetical protein [Streptomyces sp. NBC_01766]WSC24948.1 hypothetical protein OIE60_35380 [Streptomyces sp. NBC_01766]
MGTQARSSGPKSEPTSLVARQARRTRTAVATVRPSGQGVAACTGHRDLFDAAEA